MSHKPRCWKMRTSCSSNPSSPFHRKPLLTECCRMLWLILTCSFVCLVMALICVSIPGDKASFFYFITLFLILVFVTLTIIGRQYILEKLDYSRRSGLYEEVSQFSPTSIQMKTAYGSLRNTPTTYHTPLFVIGSSIPPLKPHKSPLSQITIQ